MVYLLTVGTKTVKVIYLFFFSDIPSAVNLGECSNIYIFAIPLQLNTMGATVAEW